MFGGEGLWPVVGQLIILAESDSAVVLIIGSAAADRRGSAGWHTDGRRKKDGSVKAGRLPECMLFTWKRLSILELLRKKKSSLSGRQQTDWRAPLSTEATARHTDLGLREIYHVHQRRRLWTERPCRDNSIINLRVCQSV